MNDPSATACGSRRLVTSTLGSRAPVASARHIPRLVFSLPSLPAADLRNLCCRDRCTGGVHCGVAGHISPVLETNQADIRTAYLWGPSQSHMATANPDFPMPIFLHFEPEVRANAHPHALDYRPQPRFLYRLGMRRRDCGRRVLRTR